MSGRIAKIAPTAIVLAVMGYLCWPYFNEAPDAPDETKENKLPVIATALLSPPPEPAPDRDPFKQPGQTKSAAPVAPKPKTPATARSLADAVNTMNGQVLNATYIHGERRLALISNRIYAEGEELKSQSSTASPLTVARIYPDKVLLRRDGVTLELKYVTPASRPADGASSPRAGPPAGKGDAPEVATQVKPEKTG
jgi:hypothetical protein